MAAITGAAITAGAAAYSANRQANAASDAARAGADAANQGRADIRGYYDQFSTNAQPYMGMGANAVSGLNRLMAGDYSQALNSPDVRARFDMGLQASDRSAAARGGLNSGRHAADLMNYGGQMASQGIGDYRSALMNMANMGAGMTSNLGSAGLSAASGMAHQGNLAGSARASGYQQSADANSQGAFGLAGIFNNLSQNNWGRSGVKPIGATDPYKG